MKSKIQLNKTNITIRPSSIDSFLGCSYQWARVFLTGESSIPSGRATIGTGIHSGAHSLWSEAMIKKDKGAMNLAAAKDVAVAKYQEEVKNYGISHDYGEDDNTAIGEIVEGVTAFMDDIVPFTEIPEKIEHRFTIEIPGHPVVKALSGTVDYIGHGVLADLKSSKRKATVQNYEIQQSIYKQLAMANGEVVNHNMIQNVVLSTKPNGQILELIPNIPKAKTIVNNLLDTLEVLVTDMVKPELLFRGNPKYFLCSEKYCAFYKDCVFVSGEEESAPSVKL